MKVSLLSENLSEKLLLVNHAVSNRSQLPILLNFLIKAEKGVLSVSGTDLEIGIKIEIPSKTEEEGETTVSAKTFSELLSTIPIGKISLVTKEKGLELTGEKIKAMFQTSKAEEFPKLYEDKGEEIVVLGKDVFGKGFPKVVFAASQDQTRPALSGVLIKEVEEDGKNFLLMVATDGYRLSLKKNPLDKKSGEKREVSMLVPSRVIRELLVLSKGADRVSVYASKENNQIVFYQGDTTLVGRLIEGEFPLFEKIIPKDFSTKTIFDKEALRKAVKACYVFARSSANIIKLSIQKEKIIVHVNSPQVGENTVEVEAQTSGEENEIAFNGRYLLDLFSNIEEESMVFEMTGPLNPGVFKIKGDDTFLHLIMPIRVQQEA
ncbi:MAG: DNA polymerase III subunit beta [Candidatus Levybacteria bacterium RIFCSPHIGHO2_02_FULL_37_13]|nr:MAG: DNA polymerase III subunit beta [Candidatus Levybacteria bacterium RIFCSPHIGHO2_02_FULL_37_13]OGH39703.1 MAG: DNA polymerase III subunit beta [Candidatus Levybacteria bacterium RIFCSPLOWO2_01_FULL_37_26]